MHPIFSINTLLLLLVSAVLCVSAQQQVELPDPDKILGVGVTIFIVIVVAVVVVVLGTIIAICFCCGVLCFRKKGPSRPQLHMYPNGDFGQQVAYVPQGNPKVGGGPMVGTPYPQPQPPQLSPQAQPFNVPHPQPQLPPPPVHTDSFRRPAESQSHTHGNIPLQESSFKSTSPMMVQENFQSSVPTSPVSPISPSPYQATQSTGFSYQGPSQIGVENPAYNADPNYIPNRFRSPNGAKPQRNDPAWNAITNEVKTWQKDHNIYYGNTYKPGAYGPAGGSRGGSAPPVENANPAYTPNDNFSMY